MTGRSGRRAHPALEREQAAVGLGDVVPEDPSRVHAIGHADELEVDPVFLAVGEIPGAGRRLQPFKLPGRLRFRMAAGPGGD
ncbi:MAG: hypothetical protein CMJ54_01565 [Planctomycetaceae bacterium]|nr:hypothetical protein [Planctomycetaceae bacterium]